MKDLTILILAIMIFWPTVIINDGNGKTRIQFSGLFLMLVGYFYNLLKDE